MKTYFAAKREADARNRKPAADGRVWKVVEKRNGLWGVALVWK